MYQEIKRSIFTVSKIGFSIFILIYFGANLVSCEENIPYYLRSMKKLEDDVKEWRGNCLNDKLHDINTSCCKAVKEYNQDRRKMQRRLCFFKGNHHSTLILCTMQHAIDYKLVTQQVVLDF
jgi:hypothetical protein